MVGTPAPLLMTDKHAETAPVAVVKLTVENPQPVCRHQPFDLREGVVFEVFMTDRVVGVLLEHQRHIALLKHPDPRWIEYGGNIGDEGVWIVEIIEHGNRGHCTGVPAPGNRPVSPCGEKTGNELEVAKISLELLNKRVDADANKRVRVLPEQGAVIAADIEDDVACGQFKPAHQLVSDAREMFSHRLVDS